MFCTEDTVAIDFSTAWNPPEQWFDKACVAFPSLTFVLKFYQTGVGFAGYFNSNSDRITKQVYEDWNEIAVFLYGNHDYGWGFDTTCTCCFERSVELEDIIRQGGTNHHLCSDCIKRQHEDGGTA